MPTDYVELLYEKVQAEYDNFIEELKRMTPEQVIEKSIRKGCQRKYGDGNSGQRTYTFRSEGFCAVRNTLLTVCIGNGLILMSAKCRC